MRELAVQSANTVAVGATDRDKLQTEFAQLGREIDRIVGNTTFNDKKLLNGDADSDGNKISFEATFNVGANTAADNQVKISISDMGLKSLGIGDDSTGSMELNISIGATDGNGNVTDSDGSNARTAIKAIDAVIKLVDTQRSNLGAVQNNFITTISNLQSSIENNSAARSRIMDADFAQETSNVSRGQILNKRELQCWLRQIKARRVCYHC